MAGGSGRIHSLNRSRKENFFEYMKLNPYYFKSVFPGMTVQKAWEEASKLKINNDYPDFEGDMTCQE